MSSIQAGQFGMLQFISSVLTILLSGVVAAAAAFIMNSSKEHTFQLRQKGEDLVGEILRLKKLLVNKSIVATKVAYELRAELESIVDASGNYKVGKSAKDEDDFMIKLHERVINYKKDLDDNISQSFIKIEVLSNLYFSENVNDLNNIKEQINLINSEISNYRAIEHVDNMDEFDKEISGLENFNRHISHKITHVFDAYLSNVIDIVSIYTQREFIIPNIITRSSKKSKRK